MRADGVVEANEMRSLLAAINGFDVGDTLKPEALLEESIDLDAELARITSPGARSQTYLSAAFMIHADGATHPEERALFARVEAALAPTQAERDQVARLAPSERPTMRAAFASALGRLFGSPDGARALGGDPSSGGVR
jgi:tellurite resistance protein